MAEMRDIGAVILAAGASARMGASKPLLRLGGQRMVERVVGVFRAAGVRELLVVVGPAEPRLTGVLDELRARWVRNPRPGRGMFSSVRVGVRALPAGLRAFFVHPVDMPLITPGTLRRLRGAAGDGVPVAHPTFEGRRGHPPLLSATLAPAVEGFDRPGGLRALLSAYDPSAREVECDDPAVRFDIDTPEDYREAREIVSRTAARQQYSEGTRGDS
jgi:CTP:molybdopterin cytidylyltransferase MocA